MKASRRHEVNPHQQEAAAVTVMSFNIHHGADGGNRFNLERTASAIEDSGAEVIGLQEVDRHWGARSGFMDEAMWLAQRLNKHLVYGANLNEPPLTGGAANRQYGNAILSGFPVITSEHHLFACPQDSQAPGEPPAEQRGLLEAVLNVRGTPVAFFCTHLDFEPRGRRAQQVQDIMAITGNSTLPTVLVGDFNAEPGAPELQPLLTLYTDVFAAPGHNDAFTFFADAGEVPAGSAAGSRGQRIDYILTAGGITASSARVINSTASDHLPISARLALPLP